MYVCICNGLTDTNIKDIIDTSEIGCMSELKEHNICDNCTKCYNEVRDILFDCVDDRFKNESWYISPKEGCHWDIDEVH